MKRWAIILLTCALWFSSAHAATNKTFADKLRARNDSTHIYTTDLLDSMHIYFDGTNWVIQGGSDSGIFKGAYIKIGDATNNFGGWLRYSSNTLQYSNDSGGTWNNVGSGGASNAAVSDSSITILNATAWRLFYSNATATAIQELALGTSGQYLKSNGATSIPSWDTPTGTPLWDTLDNNDTLVYVGATDTFMYVIDSAGYTIIRPGDNTAMSIGDPGLASADSILASLLYLKGGVAPADSTYYISTQAISAGEHCLYYVQVAAGPDSVYFGTCTGGSGTTDSTRVGAWLFVDGTSGDSIAAPADTIEVDTAAIVDTIQGVLTSGGYITGNETITLSGDVGGSGATAITTTIQPNAVESTMIGADQVNDLDINFGTGADQVNTDDVPEGSSNKYDQALPDSANWSTAYDTIMTDSSICSEGETHDSLANYAPLASPTFTGTVTIPSATAPTTNAKGQIAVDNNDHAIEVYDSSLTASVLNSHIEDKDFVITSPDAINDTVALFYVGQYKYPHGIKLLSLELYTGDSTGTYAIQFEEWETDAAPARAGYIDTLTITNDSAHVYSTTFTDSDIAVNGSIWAILPSTAVDWIGGKITFYIKEGD